MQTSLCVFLSSNTLLCLLSQSVSSREERDDLVRSSSHTPSNKAQILAMPQFGLRDNLIRCELLKNEDLYTYLEDFRYHVCFHFKTSFHAFLHCCVHLLFALKLWLFWCNLNAMNFPTTSRVLIYFNVEKIVLSTLIMRISVFIIADFPPWRNIAFSHFSLQ